MVLAAAILLILAAIIASGGAAMEGPDASLDAALVDGVRHGGDIYSVAADTVGGAGSPASAWTVPLPTLATVEGRASPLVATAAIMLLAVFVVVAWFARFGDLLVRSRARIVALALMLTGLAVALRPTIVAVPEGWAGLLVALSLARRAPGRWIEPVAWGVAAAMLTPAALPYAAVMMLAAARERRAREAIGWAAALVAGIAAVTLHAHALQTIATAGAVPSADLPGPGAVLATMGEATGLRLLPMAFVVPLVVAATLGWASRREPVALRTLWLILAETALIVLMPDAALIVAPLLPLGLLMVPDAMQDLAAAAFDTRRFTVTRLGGEGLPR